jgi:hypothetical protein
MKRGIVDEPDGRRAVRPGLDDVSLADEAAGEPLGRRQTAPDQLYPPGNNLKFAHRFVVLIGKVTADNQPATRSRH